MTAGLRLTCRYPTLISIRVIKTGSLRLKQTRQNTFLTAGGHVEACKGRYFGHLHPILHHRAPLYITGHLAIALKHAVLIAMVNSRGIYAHNGIRQRTR